MKKIKIAIFIIFLACIVTIILIAVNSNNTNVKEEENIDKENGIVITDINDLNDREQVDIVSNSPKIDQTNVDYEYLFTIENCIPLYLDMTIKGGEIDESQKAEKILSLLSENKKNNDNINNSNVFNKINILDTKYYITVIDAVCLIRDNVSSFAARTIATDQNDNYIKDMYFIVNLDFINNTFSIEDVTNKYNNLSEITTNKVESIEKNDFNNFILEKSNDQFKYKKILEQYKKFMLCKPELAYQYLDEEYKKERFETYNDFYNYIQENKDTIKGITAKRYKTYDDNKKVIITDQNSNKMTFNITGTMKYTVSVDNYIVLADSDIEEYNKFEDNEKAEYNIKRWLKMINNKDYKYAYKFLDDTFKNEKYGTEEEFEQFIKNKYPDKYEYSISNLEENGNIYSAEVKLYTQEEFSEKYLTIIIKSNNDASFSVSFDIQ